MTPNELLTYYANLLIKQYVNKSRAYDTVKAVTLPAIMPVYAWTPHLSVYGGAWLGVTYASDLELYAAVAGDTAFQCMISPDGIDWEAIAIPPNYVWNAIDYVSGRGFAAVASQGGDANRLIYSADGRTWSQHTTPNSGWRSITHGLGKFVAVADTDIAGTRALEFPDDNPGACTGRIVPLYDWKSVCFGNGKFVAIAHNRVMISTDGTNWTDYDHGHDAQWNSITYGAGLYVAVGGTTNNRVMTSVNGISWTLRDAYEDNYWEAVCYGQGVFMAVASTGEHRVMYSEDGITWAPMDAAEQNPWSCVCFGEKFVSLAYEGAYQVQSKLWSEVQVLEAEDILPLKVRDAYNLDAAIGKQFYTLGKYAGIQNQGFDFSGAVTLTDTQFRELLTIAYARNALKADLASIQDFIHEFFDGTIQVFDLWHMHMSFYYLEKIGDNVVAEFFIKAGMMPRPVGVAMAPLIYNYPAQVFFSFMSYDQDTTEDGSGFNDYTGGFVDGPWLSNQNAISV